MHARYAHVFLRLCAHVPADGRTVRLCGAWKVKAGGVLLLAEEGDYRGAAGAAASVHRRSWSERRFPIRAYLRPDRGHGQLRDHVFHSVQKAEHVRRARVAVTVSR